MNDVKPGQIWIGDSLSSGNTAIRQEIEVLGPDDPKQKTIGWTCYERQGTEVWFADDIYRSPITEIDMLKIDDEIMVQTLIGTIKMKVTELNIGGKGYAESGGTIANIEYGIDDRNAWTSSYAINKRAIERLKIST